MDFLKKYFNALNQQQRADFSEKTGISEGFLRKKISSGSLFNPKHCLKIEQFTGGEVSRRDLRPDDWMEIWPELADRP